VNDPRLAVVVPVYNEVESVERFVAALFETIDLLPLSCTVVLVNDGSTDGTAEILDRLHDRHPERITVLHLSRNFGHQAALTAGMDHADADAVICMDADLQHPPALIPQMIAKWREGNDIVQAVRRKTADAGLFKEMSARVFYGLINRMASTRIEPYGADFRLLSRRVQEVFRRDLRERDRFLRGLVAWVGFRSCTLEFDAAARYAGRSKYSIGSMLRFARTGLISFSKVPLKLATIFGLVVSSSSLLYGMFAVAAYVFFGHAVIPGWASTIVVATFLGGCQLLYLGLIGEYLATIFDEIKGRPLYIVASARMASPLGEHVPEGEAQRKPGSI
jgi:glycosyltransferase involved in cell wall biosynthesis